MRTDPLHTKTTAEDCGSNVWTWHCTVSVTNRLRRLPVHGFLHRLLPSSVPKLTLCKYAERPLVLKQQLLKTHRTCVEPSSSSSVYLQGWSEVRTSRTWLHSGPLGSDSTRSPPLLLLLPSLHREPWSQAWTASLEVTTPWISVI